MSEMSHQKTPLAGKVRNVAYPKGGGDVRRLYLYQVLLPTIYRQVHQPVRLV